MKDFRPDIEGLRAVAVGTVLLYHAGLPYVTGGYIGVDVFFVISGFLITGLLITEIERTGTLSLWRFYARRAKRLLPLTVVVLAVVALFSWWLFSPVRMDSVSFDIVASGLYIMNWRLAFEATDYFGGGLDASPVQHFWTLAVEEQFYLLWPPLVLAIVLFCKRTGRDLRTTLFVTFSFVVLTSLSYSVFSTDRNASAAYFSTFTRAWELSLGGLLALIPASVLRLSRSVASVVGLVGLSAIVGAALYYTDETQFPGYAALLPTLGTAAIITAGLNFSDLPSSRFLAFPVVRHVGRISYSWYLWHWPPLVFAAAILGDLSALEGLIVLAMSYVPAALTHYLVERPLHHSPWLSVNPRIALGLGGVCTAVAVSVGLLLLISTPDVNRASESQVSGAEVIRKNRFSEQSRAEALVPTPREAQDDFAITEKDGCNLNRQRTKSPECVYGDPSSDTTVVLFGDSHAQHWFPALNVIAKEKGWRLVSLTKDGCSAAEFTPYSNALGRVYRECDRWRKTSIKRISKARPTIVVTSNRTVSRVVEDGERLGRKENKKAKEDGYASTLEKLNETNAEVVVIKDVPLMSENIPDCVSRFPERLDKCSVLKDKAFNYPPIDERAVERVEDATLIDPTPVFCPKERCPAVIGDVIVYRDRDHMTATYSRSLAPWLSEELAQIESNQP